MSRKNEIDTLRYAFEGWPTIYTVEGSKAVSDLEDIEIIFNPKATILTDKKLKRKAVVKRCDLDEEDKEKAFLYAFAKLHGVTPKMIDRKLKEAIVQVGEKHAKKNKKIKETISDNL